MFKEIEKPFVEIKISNSKIYRENIKKVIAQKDFRLFMLDKGETLCEDVIKEIKGWLIQYPEKVFYLDVEISTEFNQYENCLIYQTIDLCTIPITSITISNKAEAFVLYLDVSVKYNDDEWYIIEKLLSEMGNKVIFISMENRQSNFAMSEYSIIMNILKNTGYTISLPPLFKTRNMVIQHPCNAYMCDGLNCHSEKSSYPRYLYITENGIYPYRCKNNIFKFLTIINKQIITSFEEEFSLYKETSAYKVFMECNKRIYFDIVIPHMMNILPWNILMEYVLPDVSVGEKNVYI